jgi:hypothetical protein
MMKKSVIGITHCGVHSLPIYGSKKQPSNAERANRLANHDRTFVLRCTAPSLGCARSDHVT